MSDADQVKTIMRVIGLAGPLGELEREAEVLFDKRRDLGRDADRLSKAAGAMSVTLTQTTQPVGAGGSLEAMTAQLKEMREVNQARDTYTNHNPKS